MTDKTQETPQEEKARIWAELDAQDAGTPASAAVEPQATEAQVTEQPAPQEEAPAHAAGAESDAGEVADPYAGVPQIIRDEIEGLRAMLAQTSTRLRNTEGHIGGIKSEVQQLAARAKSAVQASGGDAPSAAALREARGSSSAMSKLKEEYPEFGAAMDAALEERLSKVQGPATAPGAAPDVITVAEFEAYKQKLAVDSRHPGWEERVKTPAFHGWLKSQPREVQLLAASDSPQDAIRLLDLESEARKTVVVRTNQRLDAAAAIPTGRSAPSKARVKPVEQMSKAEYWAYLDEQDKLKATT